VANNTLGDALNFDAADTCFEVVGTGIALVRGATDDQSDQIVIGSTQSSGDLPYNSAAAGVRRPYTGATGTQTAIRITNVKLPPSAELEGHRFEVVPAAQQAVTYACLTLGTDGNGDGTGTLTRYWAYGYSVGQGVPPMGGSSAILADRVSACNFVYDTSNQRNSLLAITLTITRDGESVNLYHEIHVNNIP
jgi:MSHA biogenesis protein MshO